MQGPPPDEQPAIAADAVTFAPLLDLLARHRRLLVVAYLIALGAFAVLVVLNGRFAFARAVNAIDWVIYGNSYTKVAAASLRQSAINLIWVALFLGFQGLFLRAGGRIEIGTKPTRFRRLGISLVIFAALMLIVSSGLVFCFTEMTQRFSPTPGRWSITSSRLFDDKSLIFLSVSSPAVLLSLAAVWLGWFFVGWFASRHVDHPTALSRLIAILLSGSWIEFAVALPIHLATRSRTKDCPCAAGSWFALIYAGPILLWAVGPGLYLLWLQQKRLSEIDPDHAFNVVKAKSHRAEAS